MSPIQNISPYRALGDMAPYVRAMRTGKDCSVQAIFSAINATQPMEQMHTVPSGMTQGIIQDEKLGTAIPSAGMKYLRRWSHNGSLKIKFKDEPYVELRGRASDDSQMGEIHRKH